MKGRSEYSIGYTTAKQLRSLACEDEMAAIERLLDFRGDAQDMRLVASIFEGAGETKEAQLLLSMITEERARGAREGGTT